jgi:hypothetical protein
MVGIVEQTQFLMLCYHSETITLEEALNLLNQSDLDMSDSDSGDDFCLPNQSDTNTDASSDSGVEESDCGRQPDLSRTQFQLLQQHKGDK